jgi:hypothetical protein
MLEERTTQGNMKVMKLDVFCFVFFISLLSFPFRMIVVHLNLMYNTIALKLV